MAPNKMWKCPKCGRSLTSGGESIAETLGPLASALPDLAGMTDIKCACGAVISAKQLIDGTQSSADITNETRTHQPSSVNSRPLLFGALCIINIIASIVFIVAFPLALLIGRVWSPMVGILWEGLALWNLMLWHGLDRGSTSAWEHIHQYWVVNQLFSFLIVIGLIIDTIGDISHEVWIFRYILTFLCQLGVIAAQWLYLSTPRVRDFCLAAHSESRPAKVLASIFATGTVARRIFRLSVSTVFCIAFPVILFFAIPKVLSSLQDFDFNLPGPTVLMVSLYSLLHRGLPGESRWLPMIALICLLFSAFLVKERLFPAGRPFRIANIFVTVAMWLIFSTSVLSLLLPSVTLLNRFISR